MGERAGLPGQHTRCRSSYFSGLGWLPAPGSPPSHCSHHPVCTWTPSLMLAKSPGSGKAVAGGRKFGLGRGNHVSWLNWLLGLASTQSSLHAPQLRLRAQATARGKHYRAGLGCISRSWPVAMSRRSLRGNLHLKQPAEGAKAVSFPMRTW